MGNAELVALVDRLRREPNETEWLEFKAKRYAPQEIGEYLSALANSASLVGKPRGYLVFGIDNASHDVVGTGFDPYASKGKGNQDLLIWLGEGLQPRVGFEAHPVEHPDGRVLLFEVGAAATGPVRFYGTAFIRVGSSKTTLTRHPEKERALWTRRADWTAQVCERAAMEDLDPEAIAKARVQFKIKHPRQAQHVDSWDDTTLLNKARLTIKGAVTHAAILLLGRPESASLLSPAVAKLSWILKDAQNRELDYEHFGPPFLLQVDRVLQRIRNLTLRTLPSGTLFPQEVTQYEPWVIREALHNCIAHQDYGLQGRVNLVETPVSILLSNVGSFLPGDVETVIRQDAPLEIYRNPFLAEAMVNLNMIDTQGGGIKRMFQAQIRRFFPLPDYDLSDPERVAVTLRGTILDEQYCRLLMERGDLDLWLVILLDKVQKRVPIRKEDHRRLKSAGLVEGRYPNLIISGRVAKLAGHEARHIRERGFDNRYYLDLVVELVREHGPISRAKIDHMLLDKLPEVLTAEQKKNRVHNLLSALSRKGLIYNSGTRGQPRWQATATSPQDATKKIKAT
ncbi:MAG: putative DNA binding domain-containing protein [Deferrisomatales bacterium]|nr:putative DNA binding domain-containing protein [Deferrisomatales bacterium]